MSLHILRFGSVVRSKRKIVGAYGYGKRRAYCEECRTLKPNTSFFRLYCVPDPDSMTGLYYDGHFRYVCADCARSVRVFPSREYEKIIRATSRRAYEMDLEFTAAQK